MTSHLSLVDRLPQAISSKEAVAALEHFLEEAKAGRVMAVAIVGVTSDRRAVTAATETPNRIIMLGGLSRLTARINSEFEPDGGAA